MPASSETRLASGGIENQVAADEAEKDAIGKAPAQPLSCKSGCFRMTDSS
jgi:hypothetical protein